jgi:hypothetical protein
MEHRDNPEDSVTNQQLKTDKILLELINTIKEGIRTTPIPYRSAVAVGDINLSPVINTEFELAFKIDNPFKKTAIIKEISLVPDTNMQTNGAVEIFVNKVRIYSNTHTFFKLIGTDNVDYQDGIKILRDESVEVFLRTNDAGLAVELAVRVLFTDNA